MNQCRELFVCVEPTGPGSYCGVVRTYRVSDGVGHRRGDGGALWPRCPARWQRMVPEVAHAHVATSGDAPASAQKSGAGQDRAETGHGTGAYGDGEGANAGSPGAVPSVAGESSVHPNTTMEAAEFLDQVAMLADAGAGINGDGARYHAGRLRRASTPTPDAALDGLLGAIEGHLLNVRCAMDIIEREGHRAGTGALSCRADVMTALARLRAARGRA